MSTLKKCPTRYCRNFLPNRKKSRKTRCHKCDMRRYRKNKPERAAYNALKDHARARGIEFTISFDYFMRYVVTKGYVDGKGNSRNGLTVDRKNNLLGYVVGNIQVMTRAKNAEKRMKYDQQRMSAGMSWASNIEKEEDPF